MAISATSFLLGLGAAWVAPMIARVLRPVAVEATAAGMGLFDDARRVVAEQMETLEDIATATGGERQAAIDGKLGGGDHQRHDHKEAESSAGVRVAHFRYGASAAS